ncbi:MAG: hypothetical protein JO138_17235 [Acidobacteriaceae bacterium]|nr:hypothetical protein [Acidobacteriota bacterium]MBV9501116.1 hypothetical protein [Acidobacteriaceae bacterium]
MVLKQKFANVKTDTFLVVHPLDDAPEKKVEAEHLRPMRMTRSVRYSLFALRAYLFLMVALVLYHVFALAGLV